MQVASNVAAAVATLVALEVDFDSDTLSKALSSYSLSHQGRGNVKECSISQQKGKAVVVSVIDDSYNANPTSVEAALEMLVHSGGSDANEKKSNKHIALGDMFELGDASCEQHTAIVESCIRYLEQGMLHSVGLVGDCFGEAIGKLKRSKDHSSSSHNTLSKISWSDDPESLARNSVASNTFQDGDVLLVKGSRGTRMERYIAALLINET
jgi:UDP-N-acetylmuramoyl-tripeptide--D-alanyl-D-alanine ligase